MEKKALKTMVAKPKIEIKYMVAIPEPTMLSLIQQDCAHKIATLIEGEEEKLDNSLMGDRVKAIQTALGVVEDVISIAQETWKDIRKSLAKSPKSENLPTKQKPTRGCKAASLSDSEKGKIRALRKRGMSIKAIGKEIHRAEKAVANFIHSLEN